MDDKDDLIVIPWTPNEPKTWQAFEKYDFDGILTDVPSDYLAWVEAGNPSSDR